MRPGSGLFLASYKLQPCLRWIWPVLGTVLERTCMSLLVSQRGGFLLASPTLERRNVSTAGRRIASLTVRIWAMQDAAAPPSSGLSPRCACECFG
mmetsp:Transcript_66030/g.157644  ORF Transcript_66030/g.157644 Transcript_66030/m.157644 type:complete len:95 (-) Transcript_66030:375-659(-)